VRGKVYLHILQHTLFPREVLLFQQDDAPPYYLNDVRLFLQDKFPQNWMGRGGQIIMPSRWSDVTLLGSLFGVS
jgi:hypothetical protein